MRMRIYLMQLLNEALGVPENMLPIATQVYNEIEKEMNSMSQRIKNTPLSLRDEMSIKLLGDFKIGNTSFSEINFKLQINPDQSVTSLQPGGAAFSFEAGLDPKSGYKRLVTKKTNTVNLRLDLLGPADDLDLISWQEVIDYITIQGKREVISNLAHELKHAFDKSASGEKGDKILGRLKYSVSMDSIGMPPLDNFHFLYYYTNFVENLVRPTEFASELEAGNVTKKDFLSTFQKSDIYRTIQAAKNVSYEGLLDSIVSEPRAINAIKSVLDRSNISYVFWSDKKIAEFFLENEYRRFNHKLKQLYLRYLVQDESQSNLSFYGMFGINPDDLKDGKKEAFIEMSKEIERFGDDFRAFYENEAKEIRRNAEKVYRKLAKLYAYIQ